MIPICEARKTPSTTLFLVVQNIICIHGPPCVSRQQLKQNRKRNINHIGSPSLATVQARRIPTVQQKRSFVRRPMSPSLGIVLRRVRGAVFASRSISEFQRRDSSTLLTQSLRVERRKICLPREPEIPAAAPDFY